MKVDLLLPARRQHVADTVAVCRRVWSGRTTPTDLATGRLGAGFEISGFGGPDPRRVDPIAGFARSAGLG